MNEVLQRVAKNANIDVSEVKEKSNRILGDLYDLLDGFDTLNHDITQTKTEYVDLIKEVLFAEDDKDFEEILWDLVYDEEYFRD